MNNSFALACLAVVANSITMGPAYSGLSQVKSSVAAYGDWAETATITPEQEAAFSAAFALADLTGDGSITAWEAGTVLATLGLTPTASELAAMISEVDADGSGTLGFEEFCQLAARQMQDTTQEDALAVFNQFDLDGSGSISSDELRAVMQALGVTLSEEDFAAMVYVADANNDGQIEFAEFAKYITDNPGVVPDEPVVPDDDDETPDDETPDDDAHPVVVRYRDFIDWANAYEVDCESVGSKCKSQCGVSLLEEPLVHTDGSIQYRTVIKNSCPTVDHAQSKFGAKVTVSMKTEDWDSIAYYYSTYSDDQNLEKDTVLDSCSTKAAHGLTECTFMLGQIADWEKHGLGQEINDVAGWVSGVGAKGVIALKKTQWTTALAFSQ